MSARVRNTVLCFVVSLLLLGCNKAQVEKHKDSTNIPQASVAVEDSTKAPEETRPVVVDSSVYSYQSNAWYDPDSSRLPTTFVPDSTVNNRIVIGQSDGIMKYFPNIRSQNNEYAELVPFMNRSGSQYLFMYPQHGGFYNEFWQFEIGLIPAHRKSFMYRMSDEDSMDIAYIQTTWNTFESESGIRLGMSESDVIRRKGLGYVRAVRADTTTIAYVSYEYYTSEDKVTNKFSSAYSAYQFVHKKLVRFRYGYTDQC